MYTSALARHRRLILVDIENVYGGTISTATQVHLAQAVIETALVPRGNDQIILACGHESVKVVGFEWKGNHRLKFRSGIDGADLELLDVLDTERVQERFTELVLVSGDGVFTGSISRLAGVTGLEVTVASRPEACSRRLRMATKHFLPINLDPNTFKEAA